YIVARPPGERPLIFRTTLREDKKFKRKKKGRIREFNELKPWKHHKDSTCVEENEKKLYSAVWAANKGVYCDKNVALQEDATIRDFVRDLSNERIHGLIVREIWKRSRLADLVLAKIWSLLMDHRKQLYVRAEPDGQDLNSEQFDDITLTEEEFIVGMWLIDQCLYGRKLPKVIGDEVWKSVDTISFDMKRLRKRGMMSRLGRHDYK
ncbi:DEKNAAC103280, partial [Brettanomyces naardenensis]